MHVAFFSRSGHKRLGGLILRTMMNLCICRTLGRTWWGGGGGETDAPHEHLLGTLRYSTVVLHYKFLDASPYIYAENQISITSILLFSL